ncbi:hypothetical protein [uncultured Microbacterium sp.]|uniref:hypothetical protein n=1 Tax=uncultured Microbacterium sp. TaxID=191216 RepID=UPI00258D9A77|nr:hypothetical protein [uncultured Microbacterium sp.]
MPIHAHKPVRPGSNRHTIVISESISSHALTVSPLEALTLADELLIAALSAEARGSVEAEILFWMRAEVALARPDLWAEVAPFVPLLEDIAIGRTIESRGDAAAARLHLAALQQEVAARASASAAGLAV